MTKASPYAFLMCCWLPLSGIDGPAFPAHSAGNPIRPHRSASPARSDTACLPVTLVPSAPAAPLTIRIQPDTAFRHYPSIRLEWKLFLNGIPVKKGITGPFQPAFVRPVNIHLPVRLPPGPEEAYLRVTVQPPASRLRPSRVFTRLLPLRPWHADNAITPAGELSFTDTLGIFTITSANTLIRFDKQTGWLLYYEAGHMVLLGDSAGLQPMLWQPPVHPRLQLFSTSTGDQLVIVRAEYTVPEAGYLLHLSYMVNAAGDMLVGQSMEPDTTHEPLPTNSPRLPPLTRFGMRWTLPQGFDSVAWYGGRPTPDAAATRPIDSGPDTGGSVSVPAITHLPVSPSRESAFDYVRWLTITGSANRRMRIIADSSLLRITAVPVADSTGSHSVLGIDAIHPLPAGTMNYAFKVSPLPPANPTANSHLTRSPLAKPF
jgi:beta galactosidase small subunit